jgi:hypothetical protein
MSDIMQWESMTNAEKLAVKVASEQSFEAFMRIFFQLIQGQKFKKNWHHTYECRLAEDVYYGKIKRGIINVSPGSTKTEIWSIHWIVWCIIKCMTAEQPRSSRWLPLSYSDELVTENSKRVKEIIDSEEFQTLWPLKIDPTTKSSSNWMYRHVDEKGYRHRHRLYGTSTGGQVTGRRGGYMIEGFSGAVILDDPLPPKDAESALIMNKSNLKLNRVVRSRLAHDDVPILMVQQRIAKGDSTDFLNSDKAPDDYDQFKVPALIDKEYVDTLSDEMRTACIADTGFNGKRCSYWPDKEPTETLLAMETADNYMFSAQYQQDPDDALQEGVVYKKEIDLLIEEGRFCNIPVEKHLPVFTYWDLALGDRMVIWLMQPIGKELRLIACYGNNNEGMEHYINWLKDFQAKYGIRYEQHLAPHDIAVRDLLTKESRIARAEMMGIKFKLVERCKTKRESINALKNLFPRMWIDKVRCDTDLSGNTGDMATYTGWKALKGLRRAWDHNNEIFKDEAGPKWCTDFCDALQQMGLFYKEKVKEKPKRKRINSPGGWMRT